MDCLERHEVWRTRWDIIGAVIRDLPLEDPPCPGKGVCHGSLSWCSSCGSVGDVCHIQTWPEVCDTHERYPENPLDYASQESFKFL